LNNYIVDVDLCCCLVVDNQCAH